jgi:hypothetical protein
MSEVTCGYKGCKGTLKLVEETHKKKTVRKMVCTLCGREYLLEDPEKKRRKRRFSQNLADYVERVTSSPSPDVTYAGNDSIGNITESEREKDRLANEKHRRENQGW